MKTRIIRPLLLAVFIAVSSCINHDSFPVLEGAYPASGYPDDKPGIFSPGALCTGLNERDITISPEGKEIFYGLSTGKMVTIMYTRFNGKRWEEPVVAPFASDNRFSYFEPCFDPDGNSVWFLTTLPCQGKEPKPGWAYQNIFFSERNSDGTWGEPRDPGGCINSGSFQFYPSVTRDRTLYFCRTEPTTGKHAVYRSLYNDGIYCECTKLPEPVNTDSITVFNAFVSADESIMIACINGIRVDWNPDRSNYFLFVSNDDGSWSGPMPLGPEINIPGSNAMSSSLSPDGRYFFFAAQVTSPRHAESGSKLTLSEILESSASTQNGNYDIYWVNADVIMKSAEELRITYEE